MAGQVVEVELTIRAAVTVTDDVKKGMAEQYSYTPEQLADNDLVGRAMLYASLNPRLPSDNNHFDDFWDGVANMRGLIKKIELAEF